LPHPDLPYKGQFPGQMNNHSIVYLICRTSEVPLGHFHLKVTLVLVDFLKNTLVASMSFGFVCSSQSFLPSAAHHEPRFAQAAKATLKRF